MELVRSDVRVKGGGNKTGKSPPKTHGQQATKENQADECAARGCVTTAALVDHTRRQPEVEAMQGLGSDLGTPRPCGQHVGAWGAAL